MDRARYDQLIKKRGDVGLTDDEGERARAADG